MRRDPCRSSTALRAADSTSGSGTPSSRRRSARTSSPSPSPSAPTTPSATAQPGRGPDARERRLELVRRAVRAAHHDDILRAAVHVELRQAGDEPEVARVEPPVACRRRPRWPPDPRGSRGAATARARRCGRATPPRRALRRRRATRPLPPGRASPRGPASREPGETTPSRASRTGSTRRPSRPAARPSEGDRERSPRRAVTGTSAVPSSPYGANRRRNDASSRPTPARRRRARHARTRDRLPASSSSAHPLRGTGVGEARRRRDRAAVTRHRAQPERGPRDERLGRMRVTSGPP